jgi:hypothetical protein
MTIFPFQDMPSLKLNAFHFSGDYQERSQQYGKRLNKEAANLGKYPVNQDPIPLPLYLQPQRL